MFKYTILNNLDDKRIIPFLLNDERATIYHHPSWLKAISRSFHHQSFYLLVEDDDKRINGLVPLVKINSIIEGKEIVSVPFSAHCQLLVTKDITNDFFFFTKKFWKTL